MGLYPKNIREYLDLQGIPYGPDSEAYLVDEVSGSDSNPGKSFESPLATIVEAEDKTAGDQNDTIFMLPGDTAEAPAATIAWDKDYVHLIGLGGDLPGMGQRCRIEAGADVDISPVLTVSGQGCIFKNLKITNMKDANTDSGCVLVSGNRNYFKNVFFGGMGHATPAARAGSYSLSVSGSENYFENCVIGLDTILRAAANGELLLSGAHNHFKNCQFQSYSETQGKFMVIVTAGDDLRYNTFEDCLFINHSANWATTLTDVFSLPAGAPTYNIVMKGNNIMVGFTGWADNLTHMHSAAAVPSTGFGVAVNPAA